MSLFQQPLLLLETAVIVPVWIMIQLEAYLTPLLATVLQLIGQFNQCLPKYHQDSSIKFVPYEQKIVMSNNVNLEKCWFLLTSFQIFF